MKKYYLIGGVVVIIAIIGVVLWMNNAGPSYAPQSAVTPSSSLPTVTPTSTAPTSTTTPPTSNAALTTMTKASVGTYLVAPNGMTLYTSVADATGVSNCTGQCAVFWPPYTVAIKGTLTVGANISGVISTITRSGGTLQVTYKGMPLYFWANDAKPGDTTGNNVNGFIVAKP